MTSPGWALTVGDLHALGAVACSALLLADPVPRALERLDRRLPPAGTVALWAGWVLSCLAVVLLGACVVGMVVDGRPGAEVSGLLVGGVALGVVGRGVVTTARARRRHRTTLELLGSYDDSLGAWVVESPCLAVYAVPGWRDPAVVVTRGVLQATESRELQAMLAHERAHLRGPARPLLSVLLACTRLTVPVPGRHRAAPALAVAGEMLADAAAVRAVGAGATVSALRRLQVVPGGEPADGTPAADWRPDGATLRRVRQLLARQTA